MTFPPHRAKAWAYWAMRARRRIPAAALRWNYRTWNCHAPMRAPAQAADAVAAARKARQSRFIPGAWGVMSEPCDPENRNTACLGAPPPSVAGGGARPWPSRSCSADWRATPGRLARSPSAIFPMIPPPLRHLPQPQPALRPHGPRRPRGRTLRRTFRRSSQSCARPNAAMRPPRPKAACTNLPHHLSIRRRRCRWQPSGGKRRSHLPPPSPSPHPAPHPPSHPPWRRRRHCRRNRSRHGRPPFRMAHRHGQHCCWAAP